MKQLLLFFLAAMLPLPVLLPEGEAQEALLLEQKIEQQLVASSYMEAHLSGNMMTVEEVDLLGEMSFEDTIESDMRYDFSADGPVLLVDAAFGFDGGELVELGYFINEEKLLLKWLDDVQKVDEEEYGKVVDSLFSFKEGTQGMGKSAELSYEGDYTFLTVYPQEEQAFFQKQMVYFLVMFFEDLYGEESVDIMEVTYVMDAQENLEEIRYYIETSEEGRHTVFQLSLDILSLDEEIQIGEYQLGKKGIEV